MHATLYTFQSLENLTAPFFPILLCLKYCIAFVKIFRKIRVYLQILQCFGLIFILGSLIRLPLPNLQVRRSQSFLQKIFHLNRLRGWQKRISAQVGLRARKFYFWVIFSRKLLYRLQSLSVIISNSKVL